MKMKHTPSARVKSTHFLINPAIQKLLFCHPHFCYVFAIPRRPRSLLLHSFFIFSFHILSLLQFEKQLATVSNLGTF